MRFKAYACATSTKIACAGPIMSRCEGSSTREHNGHALYQASLKERDRQRDRQTERRVGGERLVVQVSLVQRSKYIQIISKFKGHQFGQKCIPHVHIMMTCTK